MADEIVQNDRPTDQESPNTTTDQEIAPGTVGQLSEYKPYSFKVLQSWINVPLIRAISHHSSGAISAILFFKIVGWCTEWGIKEGILRSFIEGIDSVGLFSLLAILLIQLIRHVWKADSNGTTKIILVA